MKNLVSNRMDFESPDVEKDFPGLYASESARKSNESDFSDDGHDRPSKKDLLIGKRKDKKDKKDRGYAALEGESSPEEDPETKSPSKSKKSKSFKFPSKKEKREKSREKDGKEKDNEKEKKKDKDIKTKLKLKERKKSKHLDDGPVFSEDLPVFGVPLNLATERSHCHDGVYIPLVIRDCIDYVQECGLNMESIYKLSGIKSKVQNLRRMYNQREPVNLSDYEPPVVTSLLKLFFRELPEPILTSELLPAFEEAAGGIDAATREAELLKLVNTLPKCNQHLLAWLIVHFDNIVTHEKHNKMGIQAISVTLNPILQMSHRLLSTLISHSKSLFPDVNMRKYVPPLSAGSPSLPDTTSAICEELGKQESVLNQIHQEMNAGFVSKRNEEQLWEVQRLITQLKRKLRTVQKTEESFKSQKSLEEKQQTVEDEFQVDLALQKPLSVSEDEAGATGVVRETMQTTVSAKNNNSSSPVAEQVLVENSVESGVPEADLDEASNDDAARNEDEVDGLPTTLGSQSSTEGLLASEEQQFIEDNAVGLPIEGEEEVQGLLQEEIILQLESRELLNLQADLQGRVQGEKEEIERLRQELAAAHNKYNYRNLKAGSSEGSNSTSQSEGSDTEDLEIESRVSELQKENIFLQQKKTNLIQRIMEERRACLNLRVQISLLQLTPESKQL